LSVWLSELPGVFFEDFQLFNVECFKLFDTILLSNDERNFQLFPLKNHINLA